MVENSAKKPEENQNKKRKPHPKIHRLTLYTSLLVSISPHYCFTFPKGGERESDCASRRRLSLLFQPPQSLILLLFSWPWAVSTKNWGQRIADSEATF